MCNTYFAHSAPGKDISDWQPLEEHLINVAQKAAEFAKAFGSDQWAYLAGLWHDIGKYSCDFQEMLLSADKDNPYSRVDHSTAGAIYVVQQFGKAGKILSYIIAGHHAGLPDWQTAEAGNRSLLYRLKKEDLLQRIDFSRIPESLVSQRFPEQKFETSKGHALWIRMLYSCVVDADFLDTETFLDPEKAKLRQGYPSLEGLLPLFEMYMRRKQENSPGTAINRERAKILEQCIRKASNDPAIFTLTVPTGGGKTLSSMAFALNHAKKHGKRRIIYVIPYTSIIEQTADQFREIFGDVVVEHHSNIDVSDESHETVRSRLACENWDAPIIVTTSVQFFESLFSNRSSRCRKLHNIVNSVVVLDEVQLLPPEFLNPILHAINELHENYNVTFLLCTATQPALKEEKQADYHFEGLKNTVEIVDNPARLCEVFRRVEIIKPDNVHTPLNWEELASELLSYETVLCIVNRRDDCKNLYKLMPPGTFHLSALMCGAHRSKIIGEIKGRLRKGLPTRVISTQLVEAGVDLDFPVVYRALAGLDSIAQAAGRCNREGFLDLGIVKVFVPPSKVPMGYLSQAASIAQRIIVDSEVDILAPQAFDSYFRELYWIQGERLDKHRILEDLSPNSELSFNFFSASKKFRIIDESEYRPVIVRYEESNHLIEQLTRYGPERWLLRRLQRYVVNLPRYIHAKLINDGGIKEVHPGIFVQEYGGMYRDDIGFDAESSGIYEPDELVI